MPSAIETMIKDIHDRVSAQGDAMADLTPEKIKHLITSELDKVVGDDSFIRKIKFGTKGDERLVGSKYSRWGLNAGEIEMLYDIQMSLKGASRVDGGGLYKGPSEELEKAFRAVSDAYYISEEEARTIDKQAIDNLFGRIPKSELRAQKTPRAKAYADAVRAATMDTTQAGYGTQLVGAQYVGDMWDAAFQTSVLQPLINTFEMTAPTAYLPVAVDMPEPIFVAESTSDVLASAQYPTVRTGSNRVQVDAKKLLIHQVWSGEMEEDSIISLLPYYRQQAARSLAFYGDSMIINGDMQAGANANINLHDGTPGSTKFYLAVNGARKVGLIDNVGNSLDVGGAISLSTLRKLRGMLLDSPRNADWGHPSDPTRLVYIGDPATMDAIGALDEVMLAKIENADRSNFLNGQVSSFIGNPLLSTTAVPLTDATGMVSATGANNVKGQLIAMNVDGFVIGWRRRVRLETERIPASDQTRIVYSWRWGLGRYTPSGSVAAQEHTAVAYDISL